MDYFHPQQKGKIDSVRHIKKNVKNYLWSVNASVHQKISLPIRISKRPIIATV
jgi:hypothetical protein